MKKQLLVHGARYVSWFRPAYGPPTNLPDINTSHPRILELENTKIEQSKE